MAAFGLIGLRSAILLRRGVREARSILAVIGATYVVFGAGAMRVSGGKPHYSFFIVLGTLLLGGALLWTPEGDGTRDGRREGD